MEERELAVFLRKGSYDICDEPRLSLIDEFVPELLALLVINMMESLIYSYRGMIGIGWLLTNDVVDFF